MLCSTADDVTCVGGFIINATCYMVYKNDRVPWITAVNRCLSLNGSLAVFNDDFLSVIKRSWLDLHAVGDVDYLASAWIGLIRSCWTWTGVSLINRLACDCLLSHCVGVHGLTQLVSVTQICLTRCHMLVSIQSPILLVSTSATTPGF